MSTAPTKLKIRYYGEPVLRKRAGALKSVGEHERSILDQMLELMRLAGGVGLAAPQVGISRQMLVVDVGEGGVCLVNPRILKKSGSDVREEGCLSLPGVYILVKRAKKILVSTINENNERVSFWATDLLARAIQHEMDHLRGRLIVDYAGLLQKLKLRKQLSALKKNKDHELF
ncbi:MAG: peptide deformylase [Candidatus Omnitrophota bacterium]